MSPQSFHVRNSSFAVPTLYLTLQVFEHASEALHTLFPQPRILFSPPTPLVNPIELLFVPQLPAYMPLLQSCPYITSLSLPPETVLLISPWQRAKYLFTCPHSYQTVSNIRSHVFSSLHSTTEHRPSKEKASDKYLLN